MEKEEEEAEMNIRLTLDIQSISLPEKFFHISGMSVGREPRKQQDRQTLMGFGSLSQISFIG